MEEMILDSYLAYAAQRAYVSLTVLGTPKHSLPHRYVFDNYTWDRYGPEISSWNGKPIPARIPLSALISGTPSLLVPQHPLTTRRPDHRRGYARQGRPQSRVPRILFQRLPRVRAGRVRYAKDTRHPTCRRHSQPNRCEMGYRAALHQISVCRARQRQSAVVRLRVRVSFCTLTRF